MPLYHYYSFITLLLFFTTTRITQGYHSYEEAIVTVDGEARPCQTDDCGIPCFSAEPSMTTQGHKLDVPCRDLRPYCAERADTCQSNWKFMHPHCPQTCQVCHNLTRTVNLTKQDDSLDHDSASLKGKNGGAMLGIQGDEIILDVAGGGELGVAQLLDPLRTGEYSAEIAQAIAAATSYRDDVVMTERRYEKVRDICKNTVAHCAYFAVRDWISGRESARRNDHLIFGCPFVLCRSLESARKIRHGWKGVVHYSVKLVKRCTSKPDALLIEMPNMRGTLVI